MSAPHPRRVAKERVTAPADLEPVRNTLPPPRVLPSTIAPGITISTVPGEMDAVRALHAMLSPIEFWSPETLSGVSKEVVDAFVEEVASPYLKSVAAFRELHALAPWERTLAAQEIKPSLGTIPKNDIEKQNQIRAVCYAAGLPWELLKWANHYDKTLEMDQVELAWLPDGLSVPGDAYLNRCGLLKRLPRDLRVGGGLDISKCLSLTGIGEGFRVGGDLKLWGCSNLREIPRDIRIGANGGPPGTALWVGGTHFSHLTESEVQALFSFDGLVKGLNLR